MPALTGQLAATRVAWAPEDARRWLGQLTRLVALHCAGQLDLEALTAEARTLGRRTREASSPDTQIDLGHASGPLLDALIRGQSEAGATPAWFLAVGTAITAFAAASDGPLTVLVLGGYADAMVNGGLRGFTKTEDLVALLDSIGAMMDTRCEAAQGRDVEARIQAERDDFHIRRRRLGPDRMGCGRRPVTSSRFPFRREFSLRVRDGRGDYTSNGQVLEAVRMPDGGMSALPFRCFADEPDVVQQLRPGLRVRLRRAGCSERYELTSTLLIDGPEVLPLEIRWKHRNVFSGDSHCTADNTFQESAHAETIYLNDLGEVHRRSSPR